jgi:hypothetical protein
MSLTQFRERIYWSNVLASLSASTPSPPPPPPSCTSSSDFYPHDECVWALFVHDVHMSCLPASVRREIEAFSRNAAIQAQYIAQMSSNSAFRLASAHHYLNLRRPNADDDDELPFIHSDGGQTCFDCDVVRLVAHILNDRSRANVQVALGWDVILAQLQHSHVTSSGTFWTSCVSASAAQALSPLCR